MRIQFILPMAGLTGGVKVVFQYANFLHKQGHTVTILYPGKLFPDNGIRWRAEAIIRHGKYSLQALAGISEANWFPLDVPIIRTPSLEKRYIPDADITIATSNETADWVAKLPPRCGDLFYFIQAYEDWSRTIDEVNATWKLPLKKIVIATWLKNIAKQKFGEPVCGVVVNGINLTEFFTTKREAHSQPRILMLSHNIASKGLEDGFSAIKLIRTKVPNIQLVMFGAKPPRTDMPLGTEYHRLPSNETLRDLYNSCDVYLCTSWVEGGPLPPMEAMACSCAVVTTRVGAVPDYTIPGKTALVVPTQRPDLLADAVVSLLSNQQLLQDVSTAGHAYIQQFTVQQAAESFEKILLEYYQKPLPHSWTVPLMNGLPAV